VAQALRDTYDLLIVGAGPAGSAAACRARQLNLSALLIDREQFPRPRPYAAWISPAGIELCAAWGLKAQAAKAAEFKGLRLHSWDLKRSVEVKDPQLRGWLVDRAVFDHALLRVALRKKAQALLGVGIQELRLGEDQAAAELSDGRVVNGKVVLIADGIDSPAAQLANAAAAGTQGHLARCLSVEFEAPKAQVGLEVVIGPRQVGQLATLVRAGRWQRLSMLAREPGWAAEEHFQAFIEAAAASGFLPPDARARPVTLVSPAGAALDMDSHVGKRCLLIGEAGGFVAAFSNEGVYPAMKSGWIAAETAARALKAPLLQDELTSFHSAWRSELADYLRRPNTDLSLLMPLIFSNPQMSGRVARAFLLGQKF
jgi:flavin-dependent dehydrogenase